MTLIKKAVKRQLIKLISLKIDKLKDFADKVKQDYGHIDIIFNNAGVDNGQDVFMNIQLKYLIKLCLSI